MNFLDAVPAIRRIDTNRDDLFAVDIVGQVSSADAENLFGLLEAAYALHSSIDALVRLVDYEGADWADLSKQTLEQGRQKAVEHVGRCAVVGEPDWISRIQSVFTPRPVEWRHFATEDEQDAWKWLGAKPVGQI